MNPFEDLIRALGEQLGVTLVPDTNQSCRLEVEDDFYIQIDLDASGDRILIGTILGPLLQGSYRNAILKAAMRVNGTSLTPRGVLSFSQRNDSLILFQFFSIVHSNGEKLFQFLQLFIAHARIWKESLAKEEIPQLEEVT